MSRHINKLRSVYFESGLLLFYCYGCFFENIFMVFNLRIISDYDKRCFWSMMAFIVGAYARTFQELPLRYRGTAFALSLALDA